MWVCVNIGCYLCTGLKSCSCMLYDSCQYPTHSLCEIGVQIKVALVATNCRHLVARANWVSQLMKYNNKHVRTIVQA